MDDLSAVLEQMNHKPTKEHVEWLTNPNSDGDAVMEGLEMESLCNWVTVGGLNYSIDEEYSFCDQLVLDEYTGIPVTIPTNKAIRENPYHPQIQYMLAMNLFEGIGRGLFSTRSGVKAVNLDALVNFTNPSSPSGKPLVPADQPINYVDITNSVDFGFIEYMQWRKGEFASGFAFEIEDDNKYTVWHKIRKEDRPKSELIRDVVGSHKDSTAIRSFIQFIRSRLENGAHLVYSDGIDDAGFSEGEGGKFMEVLHKRYFMCKCILALGTVAENGTFILKINNMFTPFMVGLIYLMYVHFREMTIVKPFTSRPWTSERYVVFRSRIARDSEQLQKHLLRLNDAMQAMDQTDVVHLVPLDVLKADRSFFEFVVNSNNRVLQYQIPVLKDISVLHNREKVLADKYKKYRMWPTCSRIWNMPLSDEFNEPNQYRLRLVNRAAIINIDLGELTFENFDQNLEDFDIDEWCFAPISCHHGVQKPTFFLAQGDNIVSMWLEGTWKPLPNDKITLPRGTLVYGQLTTEFGDKPESTSTESLHIIDIYEKVFSGISHKHFKSRRSIVKRMVEELNNELVSMRPMMEMSMLPEFVVKTRRQWQTIDSRKKLVFKPGFSRVYYEAGGLVLIPKHKADSTERYLFWNWSANPYNIVNGIGDELHLGRFEKLLGLDTQKSPRFVSADRFVSSERFVSSGSWRSERNDRPLIYRNPNKTVPQ